MNSVLHIGLEFRLGDVGKRGSVHGLDELDGAAYGREVVGRFALQFGMAAETLDVSNENDHRRSANCIMPKN